MKVNILAICTLILAWNTNAFSQGYSSILLETNEIARGSVNYNTAQFPNNPLQRRAEDFEQKLVQECHDLKQAYEQFGIPFPLTNSLTRFQQIERTKYHLGSMTKANMTRYEQVCRYEMNMLGQTADSAKHIARIKGVNPKIVMQPPGMIPKAIIIPEPKTSKSGSGFLITDDGYIITNDHVVRGSKWVQIMTETGLKDAKIIAQNQKDDLALLKIDGSYTAANFANELTAQLGQTIFTLGFPIPELQGFNPKITKGVISSLNGMHDDIREYQIDATVQPGNSGGPLADENGNVIGVIVARLDDNFVMQNTGSLPQNVNYAVKKSCVLAFLDKYPDIKKRIDPYMGLGTVVEESPQSSTPTDKKLTFEEAVSKVQKSTVLIMSSDASVKPDIFDAIPVPGVLKPGDIIQHPAPWTLDWSKTKIIESSKFQSDPGAASGLRNSQK